MKKLLSVITTFILVFGLSTSVYGDNSGNMVRVGSLNINLDTYDESLLNKLLEDPSLSYDDAVYYAKLDKIVKEMEKHNIEYSLDNEQITTSINDDYIRLNTDDFRERVLSLEEEAVKSALLSDIKLRSEGITDLRNLSKNYLSANQFSQQTFKVEYPDGSSVNFITNTIEDDPEKVTSVFSPEEKIEIENGYYNESNGSINLASSPFDGCTPTGATPNIVGPWNKTSCIDREFNKIYYDYGGLWPSGKTLQYTSRTEWSFSSPGSHSKIQDLFTWQWYGVVKNPNTSPEYNFSVAPVKDTGSSSSAGAVQVQSESMNNTSKKGSGTNGKIQGYADAIFKVTKSFSATWGVLSVNVDTGQQWHQYAITEVDGWSEVMKFAGEYK
ncbi:hypothetical protein CXK86_23735 [Paenibacillus sp. BGI2013]|uniref:hypothetical protein n=1 Tax=Paenibacillus sp. BGI2013 TaxID=2058902 RepID=UPI000C6D5E8D|nr:hypothetical protein [Paenibacillus sp. BGI2013]PKQ88723.1 hypothetical protein CXK86_23735 [Paenibacillus sp. BGI2013]